MYVVLLFEVCIFMVDKMYGDRCGKRIASLDEIVYIAYGPKEISEIDYWERFDLCERHHRELMELLCRLKNE
jgi:hypothetical protein